MWRNTLNQVDCIRLHYTADPAKRTTEWRAEAQKGMAPYQWDKEFELDFHARGGQPIFPICFWAAARSCS